MKKYFALLLLLFISSFLAAQQKTHVVIAKETLYGLSKKYNITIDELREANPQLRKRALQIGETLIIPDKKSTATSVPTQENITENITSNSEYIYITIEPKQTLYGLSRKYKTSIETIKQLNPTMDEKGPKIGEVLKIPNNAKTTQTNNNKKDKQPKTELQEPQSTITSTPDYTKDAVNVVLFLPFHTESSDNNTNKNIATQFYSGAKLAMDSLSNRGKKIHVKIIDSGNDNKFNEILNTYDFSDTHLIIGPLYKSSLITAANKIKKIPIVSPFASSDELDSYENLILYNTKEQILANKLVTEMLKKYSGEKIYVVYDNDHFNTAIHFQSSILNKKNNAEVILTKNISEVKPSQNLVTEEYEKIYAILVSDQNDFTKNYLDNLLSIDTHLVQPVSLFYSTLFDDSKYESKLLDLGLIYSDTNYVNEYGFNEQKTLNFYKKKYCSIPTKYAVSGFDVTYDILSRIDHKGALSNSAMKAEAKQLSNKYSFSRIKKNGAWANQGSRIIQLLK